ncbi:MAG: uroporphyrinogen-III C-methyltransferase, partial [Deltaproteobacteria bacterium]|nr:uroporphyrinogen-III C-methyltransferase [Deltaproteobacteria bacterium]
MTSPGKVYLVGAGPGDPELITARGLRRLREADVVLYDALVHPDQLSAARPDAELVFVGKRAGRASERQTEINRQLAQAARAGKTVVRLKGGDPYLFGRGSEEAELLASEGIPFEVVPGVPSPLAATAYAGLSLTHRELASSVAYVTATESVEKDRTGHDWSKLATATQTLVIFMGMRKLDS